MGEGGEGLNQQGSIWTCAKILPDRPLCTSYPLNLNLTLSEDAWSLVVTALHADPLASVLLTRAEEEHATFVLSR
jgi:hypothetical protein